MAVIVDAESVDEACSKIYNEVLSFGELEDSRAGAVRVCRNVVCEILFPQRPWCLTRVPPYNVGYAAAETIWILAGMDESQFINYFNPGLPRFAGNHSRYPGAYGPRIIDAHCQLDRIVHGLHVHPNSRQCLLTIWNKEDLPKWTGEPSSSDVPCNVMSFFNLVRSESAGPKYRLDMTHVLRSSDIFRGLPSDLVVFTSLQKMLASSLGARQGRLTLHLVNAHTYVSDKEFTYQPADKHDVELELEEHSLNVWEQDFRYAYHTLLMMTQNQLHPSVAKDILDALWLNLKTQHVKVLTCLAFADGYRRQNLSYDIWLTTVELLGEPMAAAAFSRWAQYRKEQSNG